MASTSFSDDLTCSICLSVFTDPVILICGHSFCRKCISVSLRQQPRCPHCRIPVEGQPLLTNHVLKSLADKTKEAKRRKIEYRHEKETGKWLCPEHDEKLKLYCLTDQLLTCVICRDGQKHESHKFKPVSEAATLVRTELEDLVKNISADTSALERLALSQRAEMNKTKERARQLKSLISSEFKKIYNGLKRRESELNDKVKCKEKDELKQMTKQLNAIEAVIAENKKLQETVTSALKIQETERFLKTWSEENKAKAARSSFRPKGGNFQVEKTHLSLGPYESHLQMFVWKEMLQVIKPREERLSLQTDQTSLIVSRDKNGLLVFQQHQTCQQYEADKSLMPCTKDDLGLLVCQQRQTHPFNSNTLAGEHYWEIEVGQKNNWELGLPQSFLKLYNTRYQIYSAGRSTELTVQGTPQKIGFYLNCPRKQLSFYNADNMTHIHTVRLAPMSYPVSAYFRFNRASYSPESYTPLTVCWYTQSV